MSDVTGLTPGAPIERAPTDPIGGDHIDESHEQTRVEKWRARAEDAATRYQERAQTQPLLGLPLAFLAVYTARQGVLLASAAAFRLFLWLLPLALLISGILAGVMRGREPTIESASKTAGITGAASQQVVQALRDGHRSWIIAVISGAVLFLWATRTLMRNLTIVNAHAWAAPVPKRRQRHVLITTLIFAGAWLVMFAFAAAVHQLAKIGPIGVVVALLLQGAAISALWLLISLRLPDRRETWLDVLPGVLLTGFGLSILNTVGRIYLPPRFAHSSAIYGSLGVASVMLVWLLLIGQLIVSGSLINAVLFDYKVGRRAAAEATDA